MTTAVPAKVACIGAGYWGKNLLRNLDELGVLTMVCETDADRQRQLKTLYPRARFTANLEEVLSDRTVSGVAIATPAETHRELIRRALVAEKDVLVEKPLCLSVEKDRSLVTLTRARDRVLIVDHLL